MLSLDSTDRLKHLSTATLHEAGGRIGALPSAIKPVASRFRVCGPAVTVQSPGGDNLWIHRAIYVARPGDVLVISVDGAHEFGYWGEIMSCAAKERGLGGLVIDGSVRDGEVIASGDFPIFARGLCIRGTGKDDGAQGSINHPLLIGDVVIQAGDMIVGDVDGVVVLPHGQAEEIARLSDAREDKEADIMRRIRGGERTLEVYDLADLSLPTKEGGRP